MAQKFTTVDSIIESLNEGDNIVVSELSRLGRSMLGCMEMLSIASEKGINVYAVKGNWQLDRSIQSKIIAMAFSMAAEIERDLISQRAKEALRARKAAGKPLGRPLKAQGKANWTNIAPRLRLCWEMALRRNLLLIGITPLRRIYIIG